MSSNAARVNFKQCLILTDFVSCEYCVLKTSKEFSVAVSARAVLLMIDWAALASSCVRESAGAKSGSRNSCE